MATKEIERVRIVQIETARLRMRPGTVDDVDVLHRHWIDPEVRKYLWDDVVLTREQAAAVVSESVACFRTHGFGLWVVFLKGQESFIGFCGLRFFGDPPEVELLYSIAPAYWSQGLATEAARAMIRCGFEEHTLERIYAGADPPNAASFRVMERVGMVLAKRIEIMGREAIYYVITRETYRPDGSPFRLRRA
jgi:ribosomal-protein-alanine N-acetyltransferase